MPFISNLNGSRSHPGLLVTPGYRACSIVRWESYDASCYDEFLPSKLQTSSTDALQSDAAAAVAGGIMCCWWHALESDAAAVAGAVVAGVVLVTMIKTSSVYFSTSVWQRSASFLTNICILLTNISFLLTNISFLLTNICMLKVE